MNVTKCLKTLKIFIRVTKETYRILSSLLKYFLYKINVIVEFNNKIKSIIFLKIIIFAKNFLFKKKKTLMVYNKIFFS